MPTAIFETRDACKRFRPRMGDPVQALDQVSLTIESGEIALLKGPSGSGKTTLLALLGALTRPTSGQVLFDGKDLSACSDVEMARVRRRMGFVFQSFSLIAGLPVWENITYPLIPCGIRRSERKLRAAQLLADLGIAAKADARPEELSGGEQQRVAVARALVGRPTVVLADEPTSNLDQAASESLLELFR
ncbi:MAG TPA: ATP-binding cassette domain-containing protein, partial [Gemmataceae bacterium]|nr:ATP-binding cassette domain-containing protein [Gemmataceae bacterium]